MYLLIPDNSEIEEDEEKPFTFHNVSINSYEKPRRRSTVTPFTFHNVSINSYTDLAREQAGENLHSIMYLLIRG